MNRNLFTLIFILICSSYPNVADAQSKIDIDIATEFNESDPVTGTVIVSHKKNETVDIESFKFDNQPLQVELEKEEPMTIGDLILSFYRFKQPPKPKGLYILPVIKVTVGGKEYRSVPRTYVVKQAVSAAQPLPGGSRDSSTSYSNATRAPAAPQPFLKLEAFVDGPQELYPSQRTTVGYRYFYNANIETTQEILPLLDAEGFIKIGDKTIKQEESDGINAQQVEQTIEAVKPGEYSFGPSKLEGKAYTLNSLDQRTYGSAPLISTIPAIKLKVLPFPETDKPPSFKGALGNFLWNVSLNSPSTVNVGDEVKLLIEVTGSGNLDSVTIPELCCQPGIGGLFSLSDLPAVGKITDNTKRFEVNLRPLSTALKSIPSFEFSSFDPSSHTYVVSDSDPITITVLPSKQAAPGPANPEPPAQKTPLKEPDRVDEPVSPPPLQAEAEASAIEIESLYPLKTSDLKNLTFGTWWSLLFIPFGIGALLFQLNLSKYLGEAKRKSGDSTAAQVMINAENAAPGTPERHFLIGRALLLRLKEIGSISSVDIVPEALPTEGLTGKVRQFLCEMQEKQYTGKPLQEDILLMEAKALYEELKNPGAEG